MSELQVLQDERVIQVVTLGNRPIHIGRGPTCDMILPDTSISWQHAVVWLEKDGIWVRALGSSNGTWIGQQRIYGPTQLKDRDLLRLGFTTHVRVSADYTVAHLVSLAIEDTVTGIRFPITQDRFIIGSGKESHLRLTTGPERVATIQIHQGGEVMLGMEPEIGPESNAEDRDGGVQIAGDRPIQFNEVFVVEGRRLRLITMSATHNPTIQSAVTHYSYRLSVRLDGATGPVATLENLSSGQSYRVEAGNRAVLLYVLARKLAQDEKTGMSRDDAGWVSDEDVQSGVWGRGGDDNKMHVLIHRLRAEIRKAGFDPWFIEKRHRFIRVRCQEVALLT